jgi:Rieske Fe-S protein
VTQEPARDALATRRGVLAGVGLVGLAGTLAAVSGCSSGDASSDPAATSAATSAATPARSADAPKNALGPTSEIPVGGGYIFTAQTVVVTQPSAGEFKGFSAICTHMGCIVNKIADGTIDCPCHGSQYSIKTGAVVAGPAPRPLPARAVKVVGDSIVLG